MAIIAAMALIGVRVFSLVAVFISLKGKAQILFFCNKSAATFFQICLAKRASFSDFAPSSETPGGYVGRAGLPDVASGSFKRPGEVGRSQTVQPMIAAVAPGNRHSWCSRCFVVQPRS